METPPQPCCARNPDGTPCDRPGLLPDPSRGGLICTVHALKTWTSWEEVLPAVEVILRVSSPRREQLYRALMGVVVGIPMLGQHLVLEGYASAIEAVHEALRARDEPLAEEMMVVSGRAMEAKATEELLSLPDDQRELLMSLEGLREILRLYRERVVHEEEES